MTYLNSWLLDLQIHRIHHLLLYYLDDKIIKIPLNIISRLYRGIIFYILSSWFHNINVRSKLTLPWFVYTTQFFKGLNPRMKNKTTLIKCWIRDFKTIFVCALYVTPYHEAMCMELFSLALILAACWGCGYCLRLIMSTNECS